MEKRKVVRPTSPFLSVYKPQVTSMFSIAERITGIILVLAVYFVVILVKLEGILLSNYWYYSLLYSVVKGPVSGVLLGSLLLFIIFAGVYHLVFGLRYIYWDRVYGKLNIEDINKYTPMLLGVTGVITLLYWLY